MAGKPTSLFYGAVFLVIAGLLAFAAYQARDVIFPNGDPSAKNGSNGSNIDINELTGAEADDSTSVTTVKEYSFKPSEILPAVQGTAAYKAMEDNTVRFSLNVWAGWAPIKPKLVKCIKRLGGTRQCLWTDKPSFRFLAERHEPPQAKHGHNAKCP